MSIEYTKKFILKPNDILPGSRHRKGAVPILDCVPARKIVLFCDGGVFFLDRGPLMGAGI
jgi:hypothetical protein